MSNGFGRSLFIRAGIALIAGSCSALIAGSGRELDVSQAARFLSRAKVKGKDARLKRDFLLTYLYLFRPNTLDSSLHTLFQILMTEYFVGLRNTDFASD